MGAMMGLFSIAVYYSYLEKAVVKIVDTVISCGITQTEETEQKNKRNRVGLGILGVFAVAVAVDFTLTFAPTYNESAYWSVITSTSGCSSAKPYKSFQYKGLQDTALLAVNLGILLSLLLLPNPSTLVRPLSYPRLSLRFGARLLLTLLVPAVPVLAFLNPGWSSIGVDPAWLSVILWTCQTLAFLLALLALMLVAPWLCKKAGLELYGDCEYFLSAELEEPSSEVELCTGNSGR